MVLELAAVFALFAPNVADADLKPVREVVYKVSYTRRDELSIETYGGQVSVPTGNGIVTINEPAPTAKGATTGDKGTITVDVMAVAQDALAIRVTERWDGKSAPITFLGNVTTAGIVNFDSALSETARSLLPFFGTLFAQNRTLDEGSHWTLNFNGSAADVTTTYTVEKIDGPVVMLNESQKVTLKSAQGMDLTATGKVQYKPSLLVPISGSVYSRALRTTPSSTNEITTIINFERLSDSRDR